MNSPPRVTAIGLCVVLILLISGCGGGTYSPSPSCATSGRLHAFDISSATQRQLGKFNVEYIDFNCGPEWICQFGLGDPLGLASRRDDATSWAVRRCCGRNSILCHSWPPTHALT